MSRARLPRRLVAAFAVLMLCAVAAYAFYVYVPPMLRGTGCDFRTSKGTVQLTTGQTENAATIAAVARRLDLPRRAVTIALATALQESKLQNIPYGDRDSVGLFQQRPSQGWGRPTQLLDPVFASTQFYRALIDVSGYANMPLHEAAQAVQRSADGSAYAQHAAEARILATVLTGNTGHGLRCWYQDALRPLDSGKTETQLIREFGTDVDPLMAGTGLNVPVSAERRGWELALWAVANAEELGIVSVAYADRRWTAADGYEGWQPAATPAGRVLIRGGD